jgi:DNA-binding PadR family transcriptional regulator
MDTFEQALEKLERYAFVRDRTNEHDPRYITLTDDEAVALLEALDAWR